jgi:hypothetical protein
MVGFGFLAEALLGYLRLQELVLPVWLMITGSMFGAPN